MEKKRAELIRTLTALIREPGRFPENRLPPERELAKSLGVSRNLLREAIITMEALGLLETRERQGTFIALPGAEDFSTSLKLLSIWPEDILIHVMETRLIIEVPSAGMAAERRTEEELGRMKDCLLRLEAAQSASGEASSGAAWDTMLHTLIVNAAHNPVLSRIYEGLSSTMEKYIVVSRDTLLAIEGWPGKILEEHRRLVSAIEKRNVHWAEEILRRHLGEALQVLKKCD